MNPNTTDTPDFDANADAMSEAASMAAGPEPAARKRGGPAKTPEGRAARARNALKLGFRSKKFFPEALQAIIDKRLVDLRQAYRPRDDFEEARLLDMARAEAQLERAAEEHLLDLARVISRAEFAWDRDRRVYVEALGARLGKDCSRVVNALKGTKQGVDYLLLRWDGLASVVANRGRLDQDQWELMCDLLGIPPVLRAGTGLVPPPNATPLLAELIATKIAALHDLLDESLLDWDEYERECALNGYPHEADAATRLLRCYENAARRARSRALTELLKHRSEGPGPAGSPAPAPNPTGPSAPEPGSDPGPAPQPTPHPAPSSSSVKPPPLPERPVQSWADKVHLAKLQIETGADLDLMVAKAMLNARAQAEFVARAEAEYAAAGPAAAPKPVPTPPGMTREERAEAARKRLEEAERKQRDQQKE